MPTPDTALLAQAQALRSPKPRPDVKYDKMGQILRQMDEGAAETVRGYTRPLELLQNTASSLKQLATEPVATAKALASALRDEPTRNQMIGSMIVPDPLKLAKVLKTGKLPTVKSDIIIPEDLALPDELDALYAAKTLGRSEADTGWFKGPGNTYFKEDVPLELDPEMRAKVKLGEGDPALQPDQRIHYSHPTLPERLRKKGQKYDALPDLFASNVPEELSGVYYPGLHAAYLNRYRLGKAGEQSLKRLATHEVSHGVAEAANLPRSLLGGTPGKGPGAQYKYLTLPGEALADVTGMRDAMPAGYRRVVPFMEDYARYLKSIDKKKPRHPTFGLMHDSLEAQTGGRIDMTDFLD